MKSSGDGVGVGAVSTEDSGAELVRGCCGGSVGAVPTEGGDELADVDALRVRMREWRRGALRTEGDAVDSRLSLVMLSRG